MFRRRQSHNINTSVMFSNRTAEFLNAPTPRFDLVVKRNADISGNAHIDGAITAGGAITATSEIISNSNIRATGNYYLNGHVLIPAGTIILSAINDNNSSGSAPVIPDGWLDCIGASYLRTGVYANLFAAIGTTYGVGDGTTTFNVPNLKGRVVVGCNAGSDFFMGDSNLALVNGTGTTAIALTYLIKY